MKRYCGLLLAFGIVALIGTGHSVVADGSLTNSEDPQVLRKLAAYLQSLPDTEQNRLRKLDRDFLALNPETQTRYQKILERYQTWLVHLPEKDRKRVLEAPTVEDRLGIIKRLREQDWVATLPKSYRDEYAAKAEKRADQMVIVEKWRAEEAKRRDEWIFARDHWEEFHQEPSIPALFKDEKLRQEIDAFAKNLELQLPPGQRTWLSEQLALPHEQRYWNFYVRGLLDYADRVPPLPVKPEWKGATTLDTLPEKVHQQLFNYAPKSFNKKDRLTPQKLREASGSWPAYALAVTDYAHDHKLNLVEQLGPCRKTDMPEDVHKFIDKTLLPAIEKSIKGDGPDRAEQAKKDLVKLLGAEGKWPEYPRTLLEITKHYKLSIPGWTMPYRPDIWDKIRKPVVKKS